MKKIFILPILALLLSGCGSIAASSESAPAPEASSSQQTTTSQAGESSSKVASSSAEQSSGAEISSSASESSSSYVPTPVPKEKITINRVDNITDSFIRGMDASSVVSLENSGVKYYDFDGYEKDLFTILANNGVTHIRIRIWNNPYDSNNKGYGGGNNDVTTAIAIGKRVKAAGMKCIVDFHYSDFWADPMKYTAPKAWKDYTISQKETALYNFTKDTLEQFVSNNIEVSMVQIGNEIDSGLAGEEYSFNKAYTESSNYFALLNQASSAVRQVYPKATSGVKIAVHHTSPNKNRYSTYASHLNSAGVDYDVFGTSYYPHYHGSLENLVSELNKVVDEQGKEVMVLETSYPYTTEDTDGEGNSYANPESSKESESEPVEGYPFSIQSQANVYRDICNAVVNDVHGHKGIGVCYWEGAWISVGSKDWGTNNPKWEANGSGWISKYAEGYDPDLPQGGDGKYYSHGCLVDNQAFFDMNGKPLSSLEVFKYLKDGYYPDGEPLSPHNLNITLNLTTPPAGTVNIVYAVNGEDPYLTGLEWHEMEGSAGTYTYSIANLNKDDVVYFRFATWEEGKGSLYICADDTWIGASKTMPNAHVTLTCTANAFPASESEVTTFEVA